MSGSPVIPDGSNRMLTNFWTYASRGTPYWRPSETLMANRGGSRVDRCFPRPFVRGERLGPLAVVPVDGQGLEAEPPSLQEQVLHVLHRDVLGHVHGLGDGPGDERLDGSHHL